MDECERGPEGGVNATTRCQLHSKPEEEEEEKVVVVVEEEGPRGGKGRNFVHCKLL